MLDMTKVELEVVSDADMYLFFGKAMKGWAFYISKRYSKAKNKYLKSYIPKKEPKNIIYLDVNNLYDYVISNFFQQADLNKEILKTLIQINTAAIIQRMCFRSWSWIF